MTYRVDFVVHSLPHPVLPPPATCWLSGFVVVARPLRCLCRGPRPPVAVYVLVPLLYRLGPVLCCGASCPAVRARPPCWGVLGWALSLGVCLGSWLRRRLRWGGGWYLGTGLRGVAFVGAWISWVVGSARSPRIASFPFYGGLWVWLSGRGLRPTGLFVWFARPASRPPRALFVAEAVVAVPAFGLRGRSRPARVGFL